MILTDAQKRAIGSLVRWLLTLAFAGLASHKVVDGPLLGVAIDDLTAQIVGGLGAAVTLGWSQLEKWWTSRKIAVALAMPPASTEADLHAVVKTTSPGLVPTGPVPSPAEAAAIVTTAAAPKP